MSGQYDIKPYNWPVSQGKLKEWLSFQISAIRDLLVIALIAISNMRVGI